MRIISAKRFSGILFYVLFIKRQTDFCSPGKEETKSWKNSGSNASLAGFSSAFVLTPYTKITLGLLLAMHVALSSSWENSRVNKWKIFWSKTSDRFDILHKHLVNWRSEICVFIGGVAEIARFLATGVDIFASVEERAVIRLCGFGPYVANFINKWLRRVHTYSF